VLSWEKMALDIGDIVEDAPDFVEVGQAGIARDDDAMRHQRRVQLVG
jgi:hypothetical protein